MNYLAGTTIPDIIFAVYQFAKYIIDPKKSYGEAVKSIRPYLNNSKNKVLVFTPNGSNVLECSANAYLSGEWRRENTDQVGSVLSGTGYIIKFKKFPIVLVGKMQTEIALLTTEAEYISLIQSMKHLIPLMYIMLKVSSVFGMEFD